MSELPGNIDVLAGLTEYFVRRNCSKGGRRAILTTRVNRINRKEKAVARNAGVLAALRRATAFDFRSTGKS